MESIVAWALTGEIAGFLARWIVRDRRTGCLYTIAIGLLGALVGGALMQSVVTVSPPAGHARARSGGR